jgi:hypothetical protein
VLSGSEPLTPLKEKMIKIDKQVFHSPKGRHHFRFQRQKQSHFFSVMHVYAVQSVATT